MSHELHNGKSLPAVLAEMKEELKEFIETRITLLKTELKEKLKTIKIAAPLGVVGVAMLGTAYLLFTLALVGLALAFMQGNPFRWFIAFLAVGLLWTIVGGIAAYFAIKEFQTKSLMPRKTIAVLKGDQTWIQSELSGRI